MKTEKRLNDEEEFIKKAKEKGIDHIDFVRYLAPAFDNRDRILKELLDTKQCPCCKSNKIEKTDFEPIIKVGPFHLKEIGMEVISCENCKESFINAIELNTRKSFAWIFILIDIALIILAIIVSIKTEFIAAFVALPLTLLASLSLIELNVIFYNKMNKGIIENNYFDLGIISKIYKK